MYVDKKLDKNSLWSIYNNSYSPKKLYQDYTICYGDTFYLTHKESYNCLNVDNYYQSPISGNAEGIFIIIKVLLSSFIILFRNHRVNL